MTCWLIEFQIIIQAWWILIVHIKCLNFYTSPKYFIFKFDFLGSWIGWFESKAIKIFPTLFHFLLSWKSKNLRYKWKWLILNLLEKSILNQDNHSRWSIWEKCSPDFFSKLYIYLILNLRNESITNRMKNTITLNMYQLFITFHKKLYARTRIFIIKMSKQKCNVLLETIAQLVHEYPNSSFFSVLDDFVWLPCLFPLIC